MMVLPLLAITAIPTVIGVTAGVHEHRKLERNSANEARLAKFHLDVFCSSKSRKRDQVHGSMIVLRKHKLYLASVDPETGRPIPRGNDGPADHLFTGFYVRYPEEDRVATCGLVSSIATDPPKLNWIYVDKDTLEVKYGPRSRSSEHHVGPWDWTEDQAGLTFEGWEGFVAVEEEKAVWALYFDRDDDGLRSLKRDHRVLGCSLERRLVDDGQEQDTEREGAETDTASSTL